MMADEREQLEADDPGAPPGYLRDEHDRRTGTCPAGPIPDRLRDQGNRLARGAGEQDDD
jgi:hypothetical protein